METFFYGIFTFLVVLGPLVVLHEFGHFFTSKIFGVRVLEFGFGFPPRLYSYWSGNQVIDLKSTTKINEIDSLKEAGSTLLQTGKIITVETIETHGDHKEALLIRYGQSKSLEDSLPGTERFVGKIKSFTDHQLILADMCWSINCLPVGGFVRLLGEENPKSPDSLASKSRFARIAVMASGSLVNAIIPFVLFPIILMIPHTIFAGDVSITSVFPDSPGDLAGLRRGDKVVSVDGREIHGVPDLQKSVTLKLGQETQWEIMRGIPDPFPRPGEPKFHYPGEVEKVSIVPRWDPPSKRIVNVVTQPKSQLSIGEARIYDPDSGLNNQLIVIDSITDSLKQISLSEARKFNPDVEIGDSVMVVSDGVKHKGEPIIPLSQARELNFDLGTRIRIQEGAVGIQLRQHNTNKITESEPPWEAFISGSRQAWDSVLLTRNAIRGIIIGSRNPQFTEAPTFTGPVGIGQLTGEIATSETGFSVKFTSLLSLAAIISFSLALINILPIPSLDGGRIFFVIVEILRRGKRVSPEREGFVHMAGMMLLLSLIVIISFHDIARILRGESFF